MEIYNTYNENKMKYPIIINIPHSGTEIPKEIQQQYVNPKPIIANNDWFLKELYCFLIEMEVTLISANYSRYVVDLNRIVTEQIIGDDYNKCTIYSKTTWGKDLYNKLPNKIECEQRLEKYYYPYHDKLKELIDKKLEIYDKVLIIDLHSGFSSTGEKDICLGNANGEMSDNKKIEDLKRELKQAKFTVNINKPVTGGKILRKYHNEDNRIECILFELNYKKYIKDTYIGEEEIKEYDEKIFKDAQRKLKLAFERYLSNIK